MAARLFLLLLLVLCCAPLSAFNYEALDVADSKGLPIEINKIRFLSAHRIFTTEKNGQEMVELSGLAWSEDEQRLYAISDHGSIFHFKLSFTGNRVSDIQLLDAYALKNAEGEDLSGSYSDSEGLHIENADNGKTGDERLLISFENKPRLQWHQPDGTFLSRGSLPGYLERRSSYYKRSKALESVTVHREYGMLTTPEKPLDDVRWDEVVLYDADGGQITLPRNPEHDMSVCAIEALPDGGLLLLKRKYRLIAPAWEVELQRAEIDNNRKGKVQVLANIRVGDAVPVDNYEGLTRHRGNRFFMISDNNEHFMQRTVLLYFEILP